MKSKITLRRVRRGVGPVVRDNGTLWPGVYERQEGIGEST